MGSLLLGRTVICLVGNGRSLRPLSVKSHALLPHLEAIKHGTVNFRPLPICLGVITHEFVAIAIPVAKGHIRLVQHHARGNFDRTGAAPLIVIDELQRSGVLPPLCVEGEVLLGHDEVLVELVALALAVGLGVVANEGVALAARIVRRKSSLGARPIIAFPCLWRTLVVVIYDNCRELLPLSVEVEVFLRH